MKYWLALFFVLTALSVAAADYTITTGASLSLIPDDGKGSQRIGQATDGRLYVLTMMEFARDSLVLWTSTDNGATWAAVQSFSGFNSLFGAQAFHPNWQLQMIADSCYIQSSTGSSGARRIAKIVDGVNLSYRDEATDSYFDSLGNMVGWNDTRNVINFRSDSIISFFDTTGFKALRGYGPGLELDGTTAWDTSGIEALPGTTRYRAVAVNGVVAIINYFDRDVYVSNGYDIDTCVTNFPSFNPEGLSTSSVYMSATSPGPNDSIVVTCFEVNDTVVAYLGKVTFDGTNWQYAVIDSFGLTGPGHAPFTDNEQNNIYPQVTIHNDSAKLIYQKCIDTADYDNKVVLIQTIPIRGGAAGWATATPDTFRVATGADTLWYFQVPEISYGDYIVGTYQSTGNAGSATTQRVAVLSYAAPPADPPVGTTVRAATYKKGTQR